METNRRRTALAEIPVRMSQLRVSTDEPPNGLNRTLTDSPMDNIPNGHLTPSPSQDERKSSVLKNLLISSIIVFFFHFNRMRF